MSIVGFQVTKIHRAFSKRSVDKKSLTVRFVVLGLLLYFVWILNFALRSNIGGNLLSGVFWSSGGPGSLFPIPRPAGEATVVTPAYPIDAFIYSIFMANGVWIFWIILLLLYVLSPIRLNLSVVGDKATRPD